MRLHIGPHKPAPVSASESITLVPVATVHNAVTKPQTAGWSNTESTITLADGLGPQLLDELSGFSHIIVVFWLDRLGNDRPRPERISIPGSDLEVGVFATRSQLRPNPVGVSVVALKSVDGRALRVEGLDALDGTPVLDLKPYIPYYDSRQSASVPPWVYGD